MAVFSTIAAIAVAGIAVGGQVAQMKANKKMLRQQSAENAAATTAAREAGKLRGTADTVGAQVKLGTNDAGLRRTDDEAVRTRARRSSSSGVAGGLSAPGAAAIGGL